MCLEEGGGRDGQRRRSQQTSSYVIDGVRLGQNRKRPGSAWRYSGTAVAAAVFDDRQDTTTAAADIVRYTHTSHAVHVYIYIYTCISTCTRIRSTTREPRPLIYYRVRLEIKKKKPNVVSSTIPNPLRYSIMAYTVVLCFFKTFRCCVADRR